MVQQGREHRRHAAEDRRPVALDDLEHLARLEARDHRQRGARDQGDVHERAHAEDVEERQRRQRDVVGADVGDVVTDARRGRDVGVGQRRALRAAGRARRVDDHGRVVIVARRDAHYRLGVGERPLELARHDEEALRARLLASVARGVGEVVPADQDAGARIGEVVGDLPLLQQRVHGHEDGAEPQRPVEQHREVRHGGDLHADAVAGLDAGGAQQPGHARRGLLEPAVGHHEIVQLDRRPIRALGGRGGQLFGEVGHGGSSSSAAGRGTARHWRHSATRAAARWSPWRPPLVSAARGPRTAPRSPPRTSRRSACA
jgi:hypothetical protein